LADLEIPGVDLVVERDHLVGQLRILLLQGVERTAQRPQDQLALLVEIGLQAIELLLEGES
jgi:hypothetical protein